MTLSRKLYLLSTLVRNFSLRSTDFKKRVGNIILWVKSGSYTEWAGNLN